MVLLSHNEFRALIRGALSGDREAVDDLVLWALKVRPGEVVFHRLAEVATIIGAIFDGPPPPKAEKGKKAKPKPKAPRKTTPKG